MTVNGNQDTMKQPTTTPIFRATRASVHAVDDEEEDGWQREEGTRSLKQGQVLGNRR